MLITELLKSMRLLPDPFANSEQNTKKLLDSLALPLPRIDNFAKDITTNFGFNSSIFDKPTSLQKFEQENQKAQTVLSNIRSIKPCYDQLISIDVTQLIPTPKKPKEHPQLNIFICNFNETSSSNKKATSTNQIRTPKGKKKKKREQKLEDMIGAINELITKAQEHNIFIDKNNMPTPKEEFILILKKLYPKIFNLSYATIDENYLCDTDFKFKNGVQRNKCKVLKQLQKLYG
ncbi:hypothetical protein E3983_10240 [Legionella israelensis]|uniref:Uncharacterized protein n=1 Tax=Legionella israelensis TaxID=454 RepID=A0AAX1EHV9_9GAMM|nr:hypothetical protein [Legionella israelensis]QBR84710.1 hypothetical protein E3983_10240 [Legionella israelensis]